MKFEDLKPGDKFSYEKEIKDGIVYVKTRYDHSTIPLQYRETNAVRLNDGHCIVVGGGVPVIKLKFF